MRNLKNFLVPKGVDVGEKEAQKQQRRKLLYLWVVGAFLPSCWTLLFQIFFFAYRAE